MLGINEVEVVLDKTDAEMFIQETFKVQWISQCMKYIEEAEAERLEFEKDGYNLDDFLIAQIEECTEAVLEMIRQGHSPEFSLFYGKGLFTEDHREAMYKGTEALMKFGKDSGDSNIVYNDAYTAMVKQGRSTGYAQRYALAMNDEPWEANAHASAQAYEEAWNEALGENQGEEYCRKYAEMASYRDYDRAYCRLYAKTYEEATKLYSDESERDHFTEYFCNEYFEYTGRHEDPELDEFFFFDRAVAHVDGNRFGKDLGIPGFADKYVELYLNTFLDYPTGRDDDALRARNIEIAKEKCIDYFSRAAQKEDLANKDKRDLS
jgi:hypothetical protein